MKKCLNPNRNIEMFLKVLLFISLPALNLFFLHACEKWVMIISFLISIVSSLILVKFVFKNIYKKICVSRAIIAFLFGIYIASYYYIYHNNIPYKGAFYEFSSLPLFVLSILALTTIIYYLIEKLFPIVKDFFISLTKVEKWLIIIAFVGSTLMATIIYAKTSAFYFVNGINWDLIYTSDSSAIYLFDTFFNVNSSLNEPGKQPLFGVFSLPFAVISKLFSQILFFIPNGYAVFLVAFQLTAMVIAWIMLARLLKLNENKKWELFLLFICCFSTISFAFILEQYILSFFYVILTIYCYYNMKGDTNYAFVASAGSLVTSGVLMPFISKPNKFKKYLINIGKCILAFLLITTILGRLPFIFEFFQNVFANLNAYGGNSVSISDKMMQFLNFVKGLFLAIPAAAQPSFADGPVEHISYLLLPVHHYSVIGILILGLCIASIILNRKNKMAIISFCWVCFSFFILFIIG